MSDDKDVEFTPQQADYTKHSLQENARGGEGDLAGNYAYDSNPVKQGLDNEILKHRAIGRRMSVMAVVIMASFSIAFFTYAIIYGHRFIKIYASHVHQWVLVNQDGVSSSILPLVIPVIPATFFSVLGLATTVTCVRFISSYVNSTPQSQESSSLVERLAREVGNIIRVAKGGGD